MSQCSVSCLASSHENHKYTGPRENETSCVHTLVAIHIKSNPIHNKNCNEKGNTAKD